jgi:hypothetical protein
MSLKNGKNICIRRRVTKYRQMPICQHITRPNALLSSTRRKNKDIKPIPKSSSGTDPTMIHHERNSEAKPNTLYPVALRFCAIFCVLHLAIDFSGTLYCLLVVRPQVCLICQLYIHGVNTNKCESSYNSRHFDFRSSLSKYKMKLNIL